MIMQVGTIGLGRMADMFVLSGRWHIDFASAAITGIGVGAVIALVLLPRFDIRVTPAAGGRKAAADRSAGAG